MGLIAQCDGGCGATTDDIMKFRSFGIVKKVYYCPDCAVHMNELYEKRDRHHTATVRALERTLLAEISKLKSALPKSRIPDEPV